MTECENTIADVLSRMSGHEFDPAQESESEPGMAEGVNHRICSLKHTVDVGPERPLALSKWATAQAEDAELLTLIDAFRRIAATLADAKIGIGCRTYRSRS